MNTAQADRPNLSLDEVAAKLRNPRIDKMVAGFSEWHTSVRRVIGATAICVWFLYWARGFIFEIPASYMEMARQGKVLPAEGVNVLPWALACSALSVARMAYVRQGRIKVTQRMDLAGAYANYLGIGVVLMHAWNGGLMFITILPMISISIAVRSGKRAFAYGLAFSSGMVFLAAPAGYWASRPAFLVFAIILIIGLPMTFYRLLSAFWWVSEQAVRSRDAQGRFIATMSHELRTPLNSLVHAATLVDSTPLCEADRRLLDAVSSNAHVLLGRVNDVLDVAAIDAGRLYIAHDPFNLIACLQAVQNVVLPYARSKGVALDIRLDPRVDMTVVGDASRIEQVLSNLSSNAIKFTPFGGTVAINVQQVSPTASDTVLIQCEVRDTGIGIPDAEKEAIFRPFHQASRGAARRYEGVGLGLHIVKSISDHMGGELNVADNPGGGTVFRWTFPLERAAPDQTVTSEQGGVLEALARHKARVRPVSCLVVDDNEQNREILCRLLERAGHSTRVVASGEEALKAIRAGGVDIAFLDLFMPGMTGWDVLFDLQDQPPAVPVPIAILSAETSPDSVAKARDLGAVAYLTKPIATPKLLDVVERTSARVHGKGRVAA